MSDAPSTPSTTGQGEVKTVNFMDDIEYHRVADFLSVGYEERKDEKMANKLSYLYDWAKEVAKTDDRMKRLEVVKDLQRRLGIQGMGPETIKKLHQYARLDQARRKAESDMDAMSLTSTPPTVVK